MSGYNCTINYTIRVTNTCAGLLSRNTDNVKKTLDNLNDNENVDQVVLAVNDNVFEINVLDTS